MTFDSQHLAMFLSMVIGLAIPLILPAFGGMYSERSGIINLALEGTMIIGALIFCSIIQPFKDLVSDGFPSQLAVFIATISAGAGGVIFSFLLSFAAIRLKADQTITGTALNIFAPAFFLVIISAIAGKDMEWIDLPRWIVLYRSDFPNIPLNFGTTLFFNNLANMSVFFAVIMIPLAWFALYRTKFGLRLRSCGENPQAAASLGINVKFYRYTGVAISGFFGSIGGVAYILTSRLPNVYSNVAGFGFLALAIMIFGNWKPGKIIIAGLIFSLFKTIGSSTEMICGDIPALTPVLKAPGMDIFFLALPYILTLIILIFSSKNSQAPKAEGIPFDVSKRS